MNQTDSARSRRPHTFCIPFGFSKVSFTPLCAVQERLQTRHVRHVRPPVSPPQKFSSLLSASAHAPPGSLNSTCALHLSFIQSSSPAALLSACRSAGGGWGVGVGGCVGGRVWGAYGGMGVTGMGDWGRSC